MSSGLDNIMKPIEIGKEDWVEYDGIMMPKNTARAKKAWDTMRTKQEKQSYDRTKKNECRLEIANIINANIKPGSSILTTETSEYLFVDKLQNYEFYIFENNLKTYQKMLKEKPENVFLYHKDVSNAEKLNIDFNIIYLDLCCTFDKAKPIIRRLLPKIAYTNYFGWTCCLRQNKKERVEDYKFDMKEQIRLLLDEWKPELGWKALNYELAYVKTYRDKNHSPMITILFHNIPCHFTNYLNDNKIMNLMFNQNLVVR